MHLPGCDLEDVQLRLCCVSRVWLALNGSVFGIQHSLRHGFKTLSFRILRSKYDIRIIGSSMSGNVLEASGHHCLIITNDSSPANASVTDIVDPDEDKLYCFCGNIDYGEMIGCDGADREAE